MNGRKTSKDFENSTFKVPQNAQNGTKRQQNSIKFAKKDITIKVPKSLVLYPFKSNA